MNFKKCCALLIFILSAVVSSFTFAQSITLYDQPNANAKVIGTADLSSGIIPIFTPAKESEWMKVADPRNGNVGWIKSGDIKNARGSNVTFTQKIITDGQSTSPQSFQLFQIGNQPAKVTQVQAQAILLKLRTEQQAIQNSLQGVIKDMNEVLKREWNLWNTQGGFPMMIMPAPASNQTKPAAAPVQNANPQPATGK